MNSFSRLLGLEPLASERGVASVGDPVYLWFVVNTEFLHARETQPCPAKQRRTEMQGRGRMTALQVKRKLFSFQGTSPVTMEGLLAVTIHLED